MSALKKRAAALQRRRPQDVDPEDDPFKQHDSGNDSEDEDAAEFGGREHYETMGKSKLRKPEQPRLDKKYGSVAVSRQALEDADDADPFAPVDDNMDEDPFAIHADAGSNGSADPDAHAGSDVGMGSDDSSEERSQSKPGNVVSNGAGHRGSNRYSEPDGSDEDAASDQDSINEDQDVSDSAESDESEAEAPTRTSSSRDKLKALNAAHSPESALVSSLTASSLDQARKGAAVEQQQTAFDRLLDSRIKLQKAVTLSNDLSAPEDDSDISSAVSKAEAAALSLWSTIDAIRCDILSHHETTQPNPRKRKASALDPSPSTSLSTLHEHTQSLESASLPHRQSTLNHWYTRTRPTSAPSASRSALTSTSDSTISTVLTTYLTTTLPKLVSTSTPAPLIYDDTTFYQSLLTSLIASRTNAASLPTSLPSALPARSQNPKVKKNVDTKASKGRKIRYTVHEKLQNFMAAEDRSTWTDEGRREFFGSLFGQLLLNGDGAPGDVEAGLDAEGGGPGAMEGVLRDGAGDGEEGALRLFRGRAAV